MAAKRQKKRRQKHVPQRTCIVCRQQFDKRDLTRVVRTPDAGVAVDVTGKQSGRGAYLCNQVSCWDRALQSDQLLNKALNTTVEPAEKTAIAAYRPAAKK